MEPHGSFLRLEPRPAVRTMPLPLLLSRLWMLVAPAAELATVLGEQASGNPLLSVEPPRGLTAGTPAPLPGNDEEEEPWEGVAAPPDLEETLVPQLSLLPETALLGGDGARKLCACLDARGYLAAPVSELAAALEVPGGLLDRILARAREIVEPAGLFARDLADCLLLQLERENPGGSDAATVLNSGRDLLERRDLAGLAARMGWDRARLDRALSTLRRLDPHPGSVFAPTRFVLPELSIGFDGDRLRVRLLVDNLPRLYLDAELMESLGPSGRAPFREARGILSALASRLRTKLRLSLLLGTRQKAFLLGEDPAPAPLTLREAGNRLGLSTSTVQRAAASTWAVTPRGTILLCSLTGRGLSARPGITVRALREKIMAGWTAGKSDAELARKLGIPPRTVTWHRQRLGLPRTRRTSPHA